MRSRGLAGERPCLRHAAGIAAAYVVVSGTLWAWRGLAVEVVAPEAWNGSWHLMSMDYLRDNLLEGLWLLHAQPPLFNLWVGFLWKLFSPNAAPYFQAANIAMGAATAGAVYWLGVRLSGRRWAGLAMGVFWLANPSPYIFAASWLYETPTAFFVTLVAAAWGRLFRRQGRGRTAAAFASLNALILLRSAFHPLLVVLGWAAALFLRPGRWRRMTVMAVVFALPTVFWVGKNLYLYDMAGTSSWSGMNFIGPVIDHYSLEERMALVEQGVIEPAAGITVWWLPEHYRSYGFDKRSEAPLLNRNDYHNINIIGISKMYMRNALRLIAHRPLLYIMNLEASYRRYCLASSRDPNVRGGYGVVVEWEAIWTNWVLGKGLTQLTARWFGRDPFHSWLYFALPLGLGGYGVAALRRCGLRISRWRAWLRMDAWMAVCLGVIAYNTLISCVGDYGENMRFTFAVEPLLYPALAVLAGRAGAAARGCCRGQRAVQSF